MIAQQEILDIPGADGFNVSLSPNLNGLAHEVGVCVFRSIPAGDSG
jgi:hypothetical protein